MLDAIFYDYMEMKRVAVKEADGEVPMMLFAAPDPLDDTERDTPIAAIVVPSSSIDLVGRALAKLLAELFIPHWVACCSDAFIAPHGMAVDEGVAHRGDLEKLHQAGDKRIKEGLTITATDHEGDVYTNTVTYWFDSDGDIWYDDVEPSTPEEAQQSEGPILDALRAVVSLHGLSESEIVAKIAPFNMN